MGIAGRDVAEEAAGLMNWPLAFRAYLFLGLIEAAGAMAAFF